MHIADVVFLILARASSGDKRASWSRVPGDGCLHLPSRAACSTDDSPSWCRLFLRLRRGVRNGMVKEQSKIIFSSLIQYFHMELNHSQLWRVEMLCSSSFSKEPFFKKKIIFFQFFFRIFVFIFYKDLFLTSPEKMNKQWNFPALCLNI